MKKIKKIKIIDRESKHDGLKERIFPQLSSNIMNDLRGRYDPWSDCNAWNCYFD